MIPYCNAMSYLDIPVGDPHGGPLNGRRDMPFLAIPAVVVGLTAIGVGAATAAWIAGIATGLAIVSAATTIAGVITGNETLLEIGKWSGIGSAVISGVAAIGSAIGSTATTVAAEGAIGAAAKEAVTPALESGIGEAVKTGALSTAGIDGAVPSTLGSQIGSVAGSVTPQFQSAAGQAATTAASGASALVPDATGSIIAPSSQTYYSDAAQALGDNAAGIPNTYQDVSGGANNLTNTGGSVISNTDKAGLVDFAKTSTANVNNLSAGINANSPVIDSGAFKSATDIAKAGADAAQNTGSIIDPLTGALKSAGNTVLDAGSGLWDFAKNNSSLTKTLLDAGTEGVKALMPGANDEAQAMLLAAQQRLTEAQQRALLREIRWRKGMSTGSTYAPTI